MIRIYCFQKVILLVIVLSRDSFLTYSNDGFGEYTLVAGDVSLNSYRPFKTETGDIDGDGDIDMFFTCSGRTSVFFNDSNGNFSDPVELQSKALSLGDNALVDIDGDGLLDVFHGGYSFETGIKTPAVYLYHNEGKLSPAQINETTRLEFSIFPNPIEEENLNLNPFNNGSCDVNFTIYDSAGRFVSSGNLGPNRLFHQIDISNLSFGTYLLRIENDDKIGVEKFVVH